MGDRTARIAEGLGIVPAQVTADRLPGVAAIGALPDPLRAGVEDVGIDIREDDRVGPLPAFFHLAGVLAREEARIGAHFLELASASVQPRQERAVVGAGKEDVGVGRVRRDVARFAAAHLVGRHRRVAAATTARVGVAGRAQRAVVLLRAAHVEGQVSRRDHVVPLRGREVLVAPVGHARVDVVGDRAAAVVTVDHVERIVGIDPQVVVITVRVLADLRQRLAAVGRAEQRRVLHVDDVLVAGVAEHVRVVERALPNRARRVDHLPRRAGIVRHQQAAVLVLDQRIDAIRVGLGVGHANAADHAGRHAGVARDVGPGLAAVSGLVEAAAGTAARHLVLDSVRLPQCGVENIRVVGVDHDVHRAGPGVLEQRALPGLAAVAALEHAALFTGAVVEAEAGDVDDVGVGGMDANLGNGVGVLEADVGPFLATVHRLVDAVAGHDIAADARLAHADVNDVGVRLGDRDGANRRAGNLAVRDRRPVVAGVSGFP